MASTYSARPELLYRSCILWRLLPRFLTTLNRKPGLSGLRHPLNRQVVTLSEPINGGLWEGTDLGMPRQGGDMKASSSLALNFRAPDLEIPSADSSGLFDLHEEIEWGTYDLPFILVSYTDSEAWITIHGIRLHQISRYALADRARQEQKVQSNVQSLHPRPRNRVSFGRMPSRGITMSSEGEESKVQPSTRISGTLKARWIYLNKSKGLSHQTLVLPGHG